MDHEDLEKFVSVRLWASVCILPCIQEADNTRASRTNLYLVYRLHEFEHLVNS